MISVRAARDGDITNIFQMMREAAAQESPDEIATGTEELLRRAVMSGRPARAMIAEADGEPAGFCIFFYNFSSDTCTTGLFIENIYVRPQFHGEGFFEIIFLLMADIARREGCKRLEAVCLPESEAGAFLEKSGAARKRGKNIYCVKGDALDTFGARSDCDCRPEK